MIHVEFWRRPRLAIPWRLVVFWSLPTLLVALGTVGYRFIERWSWFDALYVAVVTLTSIGYGDKHPLSTSGRTLTIALAIGGISTVALAATELLRALITGEVREFWGKWRMRKRIDALEQHVIVCGYGHVGRHVCADLLAAGVPVVVVDRLDGALAAARDAGAHPLPGDATADATLIRAGVQRARALIAVAGTDADNVFITMTARLVCPRVPIVARAEEEAAVPKLLRAGATRTASPDAIAGDRMARAVLCPAVLDADLEMEEQIVRPGSPFDGKTVAASGLRARRGRILVAIRHRDGHLAFDPGEDELLLAGDTLITLGSRGPLHLSGASAASS
jgi:voltage-gated potassium channel